MIGYKGHSGNITFVAAIYFSERRDNKGTDK